MPATHYDYVIVGAGAAGCAVANRLSADPNTTVLLLEAGGKDWSPLVHMPVGFTKLSWPSLQLGVLHRPTAGAEQPSDVVPTGPHPGR